MVTQKGENTSVVAIHGNFDNAQSGVKALFEDKELEKELSEAGYQFSSANSINIGRLVQQIVYYVYAYAKLLEKPKRSQMGRTECDGSDPTVCSCRILYKTDGSSDRKGCLCFNEQSIV